MTALLLIALLAAPAEPPRPGSWVGTMHMLRNDGVKAGRKDATGKTVFDGKVLSANEYYEVTKETGSDVELSPAFGWVPKAELVSTADAAAYCKRRSRSAALAN